MGSVSHSTSDELHREADAIGQPQPEVSEIVNPARTMARREDASGLGSAAKASPAPTSGGMSQTDFTRSSKRGTPTPPADMLKRQRDY